VVGWASSAGLSCTRYDAGTGIGVIVIGFVLGRAWSFSREGFHGFDVGVGVARGGYLLLYGWCFSVLLLCGGAGCLVGVV
jgi:hypothetical protein